VNKSVWIKLSTLGLLLKLAEKLGKMAKSLVSPMELEVVQEDWDTVMEEREEPLPELENPDGEEADEQQKVCELLEERKQLFANTVAICRKIRDSHSKIDLGGWRALRSKMYASRSAIAACTDNILSIVPRSEKMRKEFFAILTESVMSFH
jgi:hypothetical protein